MQYYVIFSTARPFIINCIILAVKHICYNRDDVFTPSSDVNHECRLHHGASGHTVSSTIRPGIRGQNAFLDKG